jgi:hypothetical protein
MARQSTPPGAGKAADQGTTHIPTELPPTDPPPQPTLPEAAGNMSETGAAHAQTTDWFVL